MMIALLKDYGHIVQQFQVVQEEVGGLIFKVIPGPRYSDTTIRGILDEIRSHLGEDMEIEVQVVDEIALGRTGKRYHSISRLPIDSETLAKYTLHPDAGTSEP